MISMIACVGKKLELGKKNGLLWHLPNDLKYFKKTTSGKIVVMGKRTYDSLNGALPKRRNIVLMLPEEGTLEDAEVFNSIPDILEEVKKNPEEEVFIIGGASIYRQFLPYADKLYLTEVDATDPEAEVYFPKFLKKDYKKKVVGTDSDGEINYKFVIYERK